MRKIGINFQAIMGMSDEDYARKIVELGFQTTFCAVVDVKRQETIANLLAKNNIECETLHAPYRHINSMWRDGEEGEQMLAELMNSVDHCIIANAPIMVVHLSSGNKPLPITDIGRARYDKLVEYAIKKNVKIAFENVRKVASLAWVLETFEQEPMVGFCWDCGHETCYAQGKEFMPWYGDQLICTHIHDNCGEKDADEHLLPFDGVVDFNRFAEHIRNSGYTGSLMLEVFNLIHRYDDLSAEQFLEKAADTAKRLVCMVDGEDKKLDRR